ncbi:hypothetical protein EV702DRAFT_1191577 [Suillus placidus]|uniref:Uncharacterized protein n=1 Tax=Suillus placidus TaxID=48579 RepID=A0A9P7A618_9AGAM|nr:hypothetical protein EV702DRAFT_1191577 [Suillus placidus]
MASTSSSLVLNHLLATVTSSIPAIGDFIPKTQSSMDQLIRHELLEGIQGRTSSILDDSLRIPDIRYVKKKDSFILHGSSILLNPWGITHLQWRLALPFSGRLKKTKRNKQESQTDMEVEADEDDEGEGALETDGSWSQKSYQMGAKCPIVAVKTSDEKNWQHLFRTIYYDMCTRVEAKSSSLPFHTLPES